jgi:long-chain acyl-CoA synthetase
MQNLSHFLTRTARLRGASPAIFHGDIMRDYRWLDERVSRLASALLNLGLEKGDRVGLVVENEPRGLVALLAPIRAGLTIVPMNPKLHASEHAYMLANSGASALILSRSFLEGMLGVRDALPQGMKIIAMDAPGRSGVSDLDVLLESGDPRCGDAGTNLDDLAWIFYTSGTTGKPKGAMLTHRNLLTMVNTQLIDFNPVKPSDRIAYVAPLSHSNGLMAFQHVARGAAHVFPSFHGFRAGPFFEMVERYRVTTAFMVPTMIQMMLDEPSHRDRDISSLHTIMYGGAPMYVDRLKEAVATFGTIFIQGFAQGEAPMGCTVLPKEEHVARDEASERRLGSAGRECHLVTVRIFDDEDRELPPNVPGEIVVRGELVMPGYWQNPTANAETLRGGWLHTGDIGYMDEDEYLFITDRKKDMIISGGTNIYPREIEEVLYQHAAVQEATVFGVRDAKWGERIVAAVVLKQGEYVSDADLVDWCKQHLASFKKPSEVCFLDELPKSGYGKILKREIKARLFPDG